MTELRVKGNNTKSFAYFHGILFVFFFISVFAVSTLAIEQIGYDLKHKHPSPPKIFATNYYSDPFEGSHDINRKPQNTVVNFKVRSKSYDISFIRYSKDFADRYGYPEEYVAEDLDDGLHVIEFRLLTEGADHKCRFNLVLDKDLGLDLPTQRFVRGEVIRFPRKRDDFRAKGDEPRWRGFRESAEDSAFRKERKQLSEFYGKEHYFNMSIFTATYGYDDRTRGIKYTPGVHAYEPMMFKDKDYISLNEWCNYKRFHSILERDPSLWFKKKSVQKDYSKNAVFKVTDFKRFRVPKDLAKDSLAVLKDNQMFQVRMIAQ